MSFSATAQEEKNYREFIKGLTILSKEYKVLIKSIGGVCICSPEEDLSGLVYSNDSSSGDITHNFH